MQLGQLHSIETDLAELGYRIVAVTPDRAERLRKSIDRTQAGFDLFSDGPLTASEAFGIVFKLDEETIEAYQGFGIDLEAASGETHQRLPVPSVFLTGPSGVIEFAYVNPDHRIRIHPSVLMAAARAAVGAVETDE